MKQSKLLGSCGHNILQQGSTEDQSVLDENAVETV